MRCNHARTCARCATARLPSVEIDGQRWYWPEGESPASRQHEPDDRARLLAPFDPIVWDRRRFELLWGWIYRFEAYVPASKRLRGYYALPMLWRDQVIGWANAMVQDGRLVVKPATWAAGCHTMRDSASHFTKESHAWPPSLGFPTRPSVNQHV